MCVPPTCSSSWVPISGVAPAPRNPCSLPPCGEDVGVLFRSHPPHPPPAELPLCLCFHSCTCESQKGYLRTPGNTLRISLKHSLAWLLPLPWGHLRAPPDEITSTCMLTSGSASGDTCPPSQDPATHTVSDFLWLLLLLPNPSDADHSLNTQSSTAFHGLTTVGSGQVPSPAPHHASGTARLRVPHCTCTACDTFPCVRRALPGHPTWSLGAPF